MRPCNSIPAPTRLLTLSFALWAGFVAQVAYSQSFLDQTFGLHPEQRKICVRDPGDIGPNCIPETTIPFTVINDENRQQDKLSLDDAIRIAIQNAEVIRVVAGISASSTGRTIYDVARSNTDIDNALSVFDPVIDLNLTMNKTDSPGATFDPLDPTQAILVGSSTDSINTSLNLSKRNESGTLVGMNVNAIGSFFEPGIFPLEPEYRSTVELTLRQPLARGFGRHANLAPVLISSINTERSYFQFKDSVQELVRSVIAAYWNLVAVRVDVWARQQQIKQAEFAYERAKARKEGGLASVADVAQSQSALASFRASLITARSNLILTETALRNVLGLPPSNQSVLVPTSVPVLEKIQFNWDEIITIASQYRPDIIELKLVLEADKHALCQADNNALPQFDAIANYRWNGLSGEMPNGAFLRSEPGRFAGFNLGINFSVPIGLRQSRAALRRQELLLASDQANLDQALHQAVHQLTINYRNMDQFFAQYEAFKEVREASLLNFENQIGEFVSGRREFINVLQAITDWGNAVSQEASSIAQYNTELANVERETGTILETHGIRFMEERYGSIGPTLLGRRVACCDYPAALTVQGTDERYPDAEVSDESFNLQDLDFRREEGDDEDFGPMPDQEDDLEPRDLVPRRPQTPTLEPPQTDLQPSNRSSSKRTTRRWRQRIKDLWR